MRYGFPAALGLLLLLLLGPSGSVLSGNPAASTVTPVPTVATLDRSFALPLIIKAAPNLKPVPQPGSYQGYLLGPATGQVSFVLTSNGYISHLHFAGSGSCGGWNSYEASFSLQDGAFGGRFPPRASIPEIEQNYSIYGQFHSETSVNGNWYYSVRSTFWDQPFPCYDRGSWIATLTGP